MSHWLHCNRTMVYRGLPWYTMVYDGMPTMVHHGTPWFTMVNHGISYRCTMVYNGVQWFTMVWYTIPCLHYGVAEELIQLKYTITDTGTKTERRDRSDYDHQSVTGIAKVEIADR